MNDQITKAAEVLKAGGVILYPTDTVWGLGCDPTNSEAIARIVEMKGKQGHSGLIILVHNDPLLKRYVKEIPDVCYDLMDFAETPLTIIYPRGQHVDSEVLGPEESIAVRFTKDEFCSKLMSRTKFGLVSTSANVTGQPTAKKLEDIDDRIKEAVDYIVDLDRDGGDVASKIIKIGLNNEIEIIRQ